MRVWLVLACWVCAVLSGEDYYAILGVERDADDRTIRKAFKKLAISKHPDKNPNDESAHAEFVKINKAYEVLKDEELRKKYDQFGEEGLSDNFQGGQQYQSWQFYNDNFGIYDEDVEIQTLSRADFQKNVIDSGEIWFVNFYSTFCSHCHQLAPTWRKFARAMDGVIRIGAVNCAEDPMLCQSQRVMGYPSLVVYPHGVFYQGPRDEELLIDFAMNYVKSEILHLTTENIEALTKDWEEYAARPWIVDFCDDTDRCLTSANRRKLSAMLEGIVNVGTINCVHGQRDELCEKLERTEGVVFYPVGTIDSKHEKEVSSLDPSEIADIALSYMDGLERIEETEIIDLFANGGPKFLTVVWFVKDAETAAAAKEMKRLPSIFKELRIAYGDCSSMKDVCDEYLSVDKLPIAVVFKPDNGYDINYTPSLTYREVASFIRETILSPLIVLSDAAHRELISAEDDLWLVDYFAPWCPPCMRLMGELRHLHSALEKSYEDISRLRIGTIDCTRYNDICATAGVQSYPTSILYVKGKSFKSVGSHGVDAIIDFIENSLNPAVEELTPETYESRVMKRGNEETWIVDYFAPWCGPCQQLAPEFQRSARQMSSDDPNVHYGSVDCQAYGDLCGRLGIRSYPSIRLFPSGTHRTKQPKHYEYPQNMWRNTDSITRWAYSLLPSLVHALGNDFWTTVLDSQEPWIVDFYAPWCGHCVQFAPTYEQVAKALDGRVKLAKVDCDQWPGVCQGAQVRAYPTVRFYSGSTGGRQEIWGLAIQSQNKDEIVSIINNYVPAPHAKDEL